MTTEADTGFGALFQTGGGNVPEVFTTAAEVTNVTPPLIKHINSSAGFRLSLVQRLAVSYVESMDVSDLNDLPADLAVELERRYFWWEHVGSQPRSHARILAQAMNLASFDDVQRLEKTLGPDRLTDAMSRAEPGWINDRSWEFWRGRLALASGRTIPDEPPRRSFDAGAF